MEKSALITEKINIQLDDVRKESRRRFYESKEINGKSVSIETEYPIIENAIYIYIYIYIYGQVQ